MKLLCHQELWGKLLGAGGGGYFLFVANPKNKKKLIKSLNRLEYINFKFTKRVQNIFCLIKMKFLVLV